MSVAAWIALGVLLAINLFFRMQAERRRVDEEGRPVPFRPWHLRLHPPDRYPTETGTRFRALAEASTLLFMVLAVVFMLQSHDS